MFAASPGLKHHPVLRVRARADQPATMPTTRLIVVARMRVPYAFLVTYQTYYLPAGLGGSRQRPQQIFLGTLVLASLVGGRVFDRTGRRKVFFSWRRQ